MPTFVIAGLGNAPYPLTRHSIGHLLIDSLVERLGVKYKTARHENYLFAETRVKLPVRPDGPITDVRIVLAKTSSLMNISGPAVSTALKVATAEDALRLRSTQDASPHSDPSSSPVPARLILLHDHTEHPSLKVSAKAGGSANGHNGVKSVIAAMKTDAFWRIRLGVGRGTQPDISKWVLGKLSGEERRFWGSGGEGVDEVWDTIEEIIADKKGSPKSSRQK